MTTRKTYNTTYLPSDVNITDPTIAYIKMLMVSREGMTYDIITSNNDILITSRQVLYQPAFGIIQFSIEFNQDETINIIYETNP